MQRPIDLDREERYRLLLELSQRIGPTFDLQESLGHRLESVRLAVDYDAAGMFVLSEAVRREPERGGRMIAAMAAGGFDPDPNREDPMLRSGKGIIGHVIGTGESVTSPDVRVDPHYVAGRVPTLSGVAVPIWSGGRVIGAVVNATQSHAGRSDYEDDFTLAVVRKLPGTGAWRRRRPAQSMN